MRKEDIKIGMKVVPFQKTAWGYGCLENSYAWGESEKKNQNYLYVNGYDKDTKNYMLGVEFDGDGDFFRSEDFYPYEEPVQNNTFIFELSPYSYTYVVKSNNEIVDVQYFTNEATKVKVIQNDKATVTILADGTKGVAKIAPGDTYDAKKGMHIAWKRAQIKQLEKELDELCK